MDMGQYLELFIEESKEHLQNLNEFLLSLEKSPGDMAILNDIFRVAHTLKGMAGTMGFTKMSTLTHDMENVLQEIRVGKIKVIPDVVDTLFKCLDILEIDLENIIDAGIETEDLSTDDVIRRLNDILKGGSDPEKPVDKEVLAAPAEQTATANDIPVEKMVDEYVRNIIINSSDKASTYAMRITLNENCVLKSARVFIIFQTLERHGEILSARPKVEDIEDEKFENDFDLIFTSQSTADEILADLNTVSEVDNILIRPVHYEKTALTEQQDEVIDNADENVELEADTEEALQDDINTSALVATQPVAEAEVKPGTDGKSGDTTAKHSKAGKTVRVDIDRLDNLMNLVSELIIVKTQLEGNKQIHSYGKNYNDSIEQLERITTNIHDAVMKVRMVPVETVFNRFPRMIRDLTKELGKQITLNMYGSETEVDRTVIDEIGDPLIHILRNSVDHGIELPKDRIKSGKPEMGIIDLRAYHDGNNVIIEVDDDGKGLNPDLIRKSAIEKGFLNEDFASSLSSKEIINLLFKPGFSTANKVTDVSGRGVGLDVVKSKIEALGGLVEVESVIGKGSKFIISLPLTLAIIQALMVVVGEEKYAIPLSSIKEIINIVPEDIKLVQNQEIILLRNDVIPLVRLDQILEVPRDGEDIRKQMTVVIVQKGNQYSGFLVDSLIGQQEIVIKSMSKHLAGIQNFIGATILGNGQVALIINANYLAL